MTTTTKSAATKSAATKPAEAHVTGPTIRRGTRLVSRRHIDLLRVSSAICRTFC
ncbi:MAG: putative leader peptide [Streptosporangiaceae bacterium]